MQGHMQAIREAHWARGKCEQEPLMQFLWEGADEAGQTSLGLAGLSHFCRLLGIGTLSSCLIPALSG